MAKKRKKSVSDKEIARRNIKKKKIDSDFVSNLKFLCIVAAAFVLAGFAALQMYLSAQPPIKNLEEFKPNIVTKFYSSYKTAGRPLRRDGRPSMRHFPYSSELNSSSSKQG